MMCGRSFLMNANGLHRRRGLAYVRVAAYLVGFAILIAFVVRYYLIPALQAAGQATRPERRVLSAHALLLLVLILVILFLGLILVFRVGRFFLPRHHTRQKPTEFPDAWEESARRVKVDEEE